MTRLKRKLVWVHLDIVLNFTEDRCTVCVERIIGSKSFWTHLIEFLGDVGHVESRFGPFGGTISVGARWLHGLCQTYIGSEIVLSALDGTPS